MPLMPPASQDPGFEGTAAQEGNQFRPRVPLRHSPSVHHEYSPSLPGIGEPTCVLLALNKACDNHPAPILVSTPLNSMADFEQVVCQMGGKETST